jgi:hypothetical protein
MVVNQEDEQSLVSSWRIMVEYQIQDAKMRRLMVRLAMLKMIIWSKLKKFGSFPKVDKKRKKVEKNLLKVDAPISRLYRETPVIQKKCQLS